MRVADTSTGRQAYSGPGTDSRQWGSFGTVNPNTQDQPSVTFDPTYGPLVSVTLRPSAIPVICRVGGDVAGNGEGEWFPFLEGDEVWVQVPEGDEQGGCIITRRLNQQIDAWPTQVAGMDATQNNFAFRRLRTPYVLESASNILLRDATTNAFMTLNDGSVILSNLDNAYLSLTPDFLGLQSGDASTLIQIDVSAQNILLQANGAQFLFDAATAQLLTHGTLAICTAGNQPGGHAITVEQVCIVLTALFNAIATASPGPLTGVTLAAAVLAALSGPAWSLAGALPIAPYSAGITAALEVPAVAGVTPGVGCPGLQLG